MAANISGVVLTFINVKGCNYFKTQSTTSLSHKSLRVEWSSLRFSLVVKMLSVGESVSVCLIRSDFNGSHFPPTF